LLAQVFIGLFLIDSNLLEFKWCFIINAICYSIFCVQLFEVMRRLCWIYNYLCNQCLSPLMLWVRISIRARCITLCDKVCQWLATGWWFSPGTPVSSTNKTDRHDITEILLEVELNTINQTNILELRFISIRHN
jgi:hypothetical protein